MKQPESTNITVHGGTHLAFDIFQATGLADGIFTIPKFCMLKR